MPPVCFCHIYLVFVCVIYVPSYIKTLIPPFINPVHMYKTICDQQDVGMIIICMYIYNDLCSLQCH